MSQSDRFIHVAPSLESYFRGIVLFGRNTASYKFALAKAILAAPAGTGDVVTLESLALPYAKQVCEHLALCDVQNTQASSRFLEACRAFNRGERGAVDEDRLRGATIKDGFTYVLGAFHRIGNADTPVRFFIEQAQGREKAIRLTEDLLAMRANTCSGELGSEVEARWRLVETAWELNLPDSVLTVTYDLATEALFADRVGRRTSLTGVRPAISGYQKGVCFYCFRRMAGTAPDIGVDVDHFLPHALMRQGLLRGLDGVWNLVLACARCNRGPAGKFHSLPALPLLERLHSRNEFLIGSEHPLKPTLIAQTGRDEPSRRRFLQQAYNTASVLQVWMPTDCEAPVF